MNKKSSVKNKKASIYDNYAVICKLARPSGQTVFEQRTSPAKLLPSVDKMLAHQEVGKNSLIPYHIDRDREFGSPVSPALKAMRQFTTVDTRPESKPPEGLSLVYGTHHIDSIPPNGDRQTITAHSVEHLFSKTLAHQNPDLLKELHSSGFSPDDFLKMGLHNMPDNISAKLTNSQRDHYLLDFKERLEQAAEREGTHPLHSKWGNVVNFMDTHLPTLQKFKPLGFIKRLAQQAHAERVPLENVRNHPFYSEDQPVGRHSSLYDKHKPDLLKDQMPEQPLY